jgi:hypothetical protein
MFPEGMVFLAPESKEQPNFTLRARLDDGIQHAQDRRNPDANGNKNDRRTAARIQEKFSGRRHDIDNIPFLDVIMKVVGHEPRQDVFPPRGRGDSFDGHPVAVRFIETLRESVTTDQFLRIFTGQLRITMADPQKLPRLEEGQRLPIMRSQIKRANVSAFHLFSENPELPVAFPRVRFLLGIRDMTYHLIHPGPEERKAKLVPGVLEHYSPHPGEKPDGHLAQNE